MQIIKQHIRYDNRAILQQAVNYTDAFKPLFEIIDNSIDDAEQYYDPVTNQYKRVIKIEVSRTSKNPKERRITVKDNCSGIDFGSESDLTIFSSKKRDDIKQNGQYGMGLFMVFSICNNLDISTKRDNGDSYQLTFTPKVFDIANENAPVIEIKSEKVEPGVLNSGTMITLSDFHDGVFEDIDFDEFRAELEKHFEQILNRKNLHIIIKDLNKEPVECKCFPYSEYCSTPFVKTLDKIYKTDSKKFQTKKFFDIKMHPVEIRLYAAKNRDLNREPYFSINGRRVIEVSKVDQFRSCRKYSIWRRKNLSGYIDVTGVLETTPTRKDIKNTEQAKAFFNTLLDLEPEIQKYIESQTQIHTSKRFSSFEDKINEILKDYNTKGVSEDMRVRDKEYIINGYKVRDIDNIDKARAQKKIPYKRSKVSPNSTKQRKHKVIIKYPSDGIGNARTHDALRFKIDDSTELYLDENGEVQRSIMLDNTIVLFKNHEDFQNRLRESTSGYYEFNESSLHYIALEITTHLKSMEMSPDTTLNHQLFRDFVKEVHKLEGKLLYMKGMRI